MLEKLVLLVKNHGKDIAKTVGMATFAVGSATFAALSQEGLIGAAKELITKK